MSTNPEAFSELDAAPTAGPKQRQHNRRNLHLFQRTYKTFFHVEKILLENESFVCAV
jgi:hypothetical protein